MSEQIPAKVGVLLVDKVMAMGLPFALWQEVPVDFPQCSCVTSATQQSDRPCGICYGIGRVGGYFKFGTSNVVAVSTDAWTLDGVEVVRDFSPWHLALSGPATTGTATIGPLVTPTKRRLADWEHSVYAFCRDGNTEIDGGWQGADSKIVVEWSSNGTDWRPMSVLANANVARIYFRVSITRGQPGVKSPRFGAVRVRYAHTMDVRASRTPGRLSEPVIRAIDTWDQDMWTLDQRGVRRTGTAKMWTVPLSVFDPSLDQAKLEARIRDQCFVEQRYGANIGDRYALSGFNYSEKYGGIFTRQEFAMRKASSGEFYHKVF